VGELSHLYWQSREKKVKIQLPFQDQFPELKSIQQTFDAPENAAFMDEARQTFETAFKEGALPYFLLDAFERTLLPPADPKDRGLWMQLGMMRVALDPRDTRGWKTLADVYEQTQDLSGMIMALTGLTNSDPLDFNAKLDLATALVLSGEHAKAEQIMKVIDIERVRFNGDYPFCRGAIAEWKSNPGEALKYYKRAIEMRRYKPAYHLYYGRLLLAEGQRAEAEKALRWAARIDAEGHIKREAEQLLSEMKG
jgi:tetratricopeptide (TPR) repeat protein